MVLYTLNDATKFKMSSFAIYWFLFFVFLNKIYIVSYKYDQGQSLKAGGQNPLLALFGQF